MKYTYFTGQISHLKCEVLHLKLNVNQSWDVEVRLLLQPPGPFVLLLWHSSGLILHFPCDRLPEVNVKRQIAFHCPQKTESPICCLWLIHELYPMQKPKLAWTCSLWKKGKYWKKIFKLQCRTCTSTSWTSRINSVGFKPFSHVAEMLDFNSHSQSRKVGSQSP